MSDLPNGWATIAINDITAPITQRTPEEAEQFTYIDIASIDRETKVIAGPQTLLGKDAPSRARKEVKPGDVLVSMTRPNLNAVALVGTEYDGAIASTGFDVLRPIELDSRWLFAHTRSTAFIEAMSELVQGALYPAVKSGDVRSFEIPLPPLNELKRIADKLDRLLARVNATKARLDQIPALLKRLRQSILAAATTGKLTEEWRADRGCSRDSWARTAFGAIAEEITVGFVGKMSDKYQESGIPFLRSQNIRPFHYSSENLLYIAEAFHEEINKSRLRPGDLAVVRSGAPGTTCVIPEGLPVANCSDLVIVRPGPELNPYFGAIYMNSEAGQSHVASNRVGVAQQHFNVGSMKAMGIELPSMEEQTEIVRRVEEFFAIADRIEAQCRAARARVERLTQSLLAKAFRGELVPQDPNDEPAAVLLERIRAQRAAAPATKASRKRFAGNGDLAQVAEPKSAYAGRRSTTVTRGEKSKT